jgi:hypothetical protein
MSAFLLSLLIFYSLFLIGYCLLPSKLEKNDKYFGLFLSPAIGLSAAIIFIFIFNRLGNPVSQIKIPFLLFVLALITLKLSKTHSYRVNSKVLAKIAIAPIGVLVSGWPLLKYGFSWLSYVNDDMNNYVLAARRFYNFGFFTKPNTEFFMNKDFSQIYYFMHVRDGVRPGSELFLAGIANVNGGDTLSVFMPSILALQMVLIFSTLAFSRTLRNRTRLKTRITYLMCLIFPLFSLGYLYQLIGQVGGLSIGIATLAICLWLTKLREYDDIQKAFFILAVMLAASFIWYPEFLPFIAVSIFLLIFTLNIEQIKLYFRKSAVPLMFLTIILNKYFFTAVQFGISQVKSSQESTKIAASAELFPYFLKPHGLTALLGLEPLNKWIREPLESILILTSIFVIASIIFITLLKIKENNENIIFLLFSIILCYLIITKNGFGAFKMAMYIAPFLILMFINAIDQLRISRIKYLNVIKNRIVVLFSVLIAGVFFSTLQFYTLASTGTANNGFNEIQGASGVGLQEKIEKSLSEYKNSDWKILSTSTNLSQVKQEAIASKGVSLYFPTSNVFNNILSSSAYNNANRYSNWAEIELMKSKNTFERLQFQSKNEKFAYLVSNNKYEIINQISASKAKSEYDYQVVPKLKNHLIFINSTEGPTYYKTSDRSKVVLFQPEQNPLIKEGYMQGIGGTLLFEVINPSIKPYLLLNISSTLLPQYDRKLPEVIINGKIITEDSIARRGSAQIIYPLNDLYEINNHYYFELEVNRIGKKFPSRKSAIFNLYGKNIEFDSREIGVFASNISILDEKEFLKLRHPSKIENFPNDLTKFGTIYSGFYEDGWISKDSSILLDSGNKSNFQLKGVIPRLNDTNTNQPSVKIYLNDQIYGAFTLSEGEFIIDVPLQGKNLQNRVRVDLKFSYSNPLPSPDLRPVSAKILFLGFT